MPGPLDGTTIPAGVVRVNHVVVEVLHPNTGTAYHASSPTLGGGPMPDTFYIPDTLLKIAAQRSRALYVDVNPVPNPQTPDLLHDAAAVFASIRNLILCPRGGRAAIFQEDYFCAVYDLLQEPFDQVTATQISVALQQSLAKWEPRIRVTPSDINVYADALMPGYSVTLKMTVNDTRIDGVMNLPLTG